MKNNDYENLKSKTVAITGSTGGLGSVLCFWLAQYKANLILLDRNLEKSEKLEVKIKEKYPEINIKRYKLDLLDFENVKSTIEELKHEEIDYFIHNAGIYNVPRFKTSLGFDNIFQTNFLMPYYITDELYNHVGKFVMVGSIAHRYSKLNENDIEFKTAKKPSLIYGNSKRLLMAVYSTFDAHKVAIAHPGITLTNMTNHYAKWINWLVKIGIKLFFASPKKACKNILYALTHNTNKNQWIGPKLFDIWGKPSVKNLKISDAEQKLALKTASEMLQHLKQI